MSYAITDSPLGLLAWNAQLLGEDLDADFQLSNVMLYWLTGTAARTISQTWLRLRGSSPVVGSSRNSSSGVLRMLAAMSTGRRMPPEYFLTWRSAASVRPKAASSWAARSRAAGLHRARVRVVDARDSESFVRHHGDAWHVLDNERREATGVPGGVAILARPAALAGPFVERH